MANLNIHLTRATANCARNLCTALAEIGATTSLDYNQAADSAFHLYEGELPYAVLTPALTRQHRGQGARYIRDKWNLGGCGLECKDTLAETLTQLGMPTIPTLYPKTRDDIAAFFAAHPTVFCKPVLGEWATAPVVAYARDIAPWLTLPVGTDHFYKSFQSLADFEAAIDLDNLLAVQNSELSLAVHQVVLQAFTAEGLTFNFAGRVNGRGDFDFEPVSLTTPSGQATDAAPGHQRITASIVARNLSFDELVAEVRPPAEANKEYAGILAATRRLFQFAGIRNELFHVQGMLTPSGQIVFRDISLKVPGRIAALPNDILQDQLRFTLDLQPQVTRRLDKYTKFLAMSFPHGFKREHMASAVALNLKNTTFAYTGCRGVSFLAYGDSAQEVATNIAAFISRHKTDLA